MAYNYAGSLKLTITSRLQNILDKSTPVDNISQTISNTIANGTSYNNAQIHYSDTRILCSATYEDLNLSGGLDSPLKDKLYFSSLKGLIVAPVYPSFATGIASINNWLELGCASTRPIATMFGGAGHKIKVEYGGVFANYAPGAGFKIASGTSDYLRVYNTGVATVSYDIYLIGEGTSV